MPEIAIVMGSQSDWKWMEEAVKVLREFQLEPEVRILSAHRTLRDLLSWVEQCTAKIFIAGAGYAAHLPGVLAAATTRPVIGVPIPSSPLQGMDSLLSMAQMPPGVPVAVVAIGGARNAALLAVQILALENKDLAARFQRYRENMRQRVLSARTGG